MTDERMEWKRQDRYNVHTDSNRDLRQNVLFCFSFWGKLDAPCWVPGLFCQAKRKGMKGDEMPAE